MESYEITTYSIWLYIRMYRSSELLGQADKLPPMMRYLPDTRSVQKCRCHGEERRGGVQCHWYSSGMKTKVRIWLQERMYRGRTEEDPALSLVGHQWRVCMEQIWIPSMSPYLIPPGKKQTKLLCLECQGSWGWTGDSCNQQSMIWFLLSTTSTYLTSLKVRAKECFIIHPDQMLQEC